MKDKLPQSKQEEKRTLTKFTPCEREIAAPGGTKTGVLYGGAQCGGGLWTYWADIYDSNGNVSGREKFTVRCDCLQRWMVENGRDIHDPKDPLKNKTAAPHGAKRETAPGKKVTA